MIHPLTGARYRDQRNLRLSPATAVNAGAGPNPSSAEGSCRCRPTLRSELMNGRAFLVESDG